MTDLSPFWKPLPRGLCSPPCAGNFWGLALKLSISTTKLLLLAVKVMSYLMTKVLLQPLLLLLLTAPALLALALMLA